MKHFAQAPIAQTEEVVMHELSEQELEQVMGACDNCNDNCCCENNCCGFENGFNRDFGEFGNGFFGRGNFGF